MRGVAAICVVQYHASDLFGFQLASSYLAVDLFFILSGMVLAHAYEQRIRDGLPLSTFLAIRLVRLYPLYIVGTIASFMFLVVTHFIGRDPALSLSGVLPTLALGLLFLPAPPNTILGNIDIFPLLYPAWSLFFELAINVVYALLIPILSTRLLVFVVILGGVLVVESAQWFGGLNTGFNWEYFSGGIGRVTFSFFAGVLMFRCIPNWRIGGYFSLVCVAASVLVYAIPKTEFRPLADCLAVFVLFPALTFFAAVSEPSVKLRRVFGFLGGISYAIYALHAPFLWWLKGVAPRLSGGIQLAEWSPAAGLGAILILLVIALLFDRYYDTPLRRQLMSQLRLNKARNVVGGLP